MKKCFKCGQEKSLDDFYRHPQMADGRLNKCKECNKKDVKENRAAKVEYYRAYDAMRFQKDPKVKERVKKYRDTDKGKRSVRASAERWNEKNPEKKAAHRKVQRAVRAGKLQKSLTCQDCGEVGKLHGHHADYSLPLSVEWLCQTCHWKRHGIRVERS